MMSGVGNGASMNSLRKAAKCDLLDFDGNNNESQDDQIQMSSMIHEQQLDYLKTFQIVCSKLVNLFNTFQAPNLIWKMVNYLSFILEKNTDDTDKLIECLN